jgi:protein-S-isoprenylcysteine O-methyltransferase Ste14
VYWRRRSVIRVLLVGALHLGRLWSANVSVKAGHRAVETGPYRLMRHPIYAGFIVAYGAARSCARPSCRSVPSHA